MTLLIVAVVVLVIVAALATALKGGRKSSGASVPTTLPVKAKEYFFSRSENAFFTGLERALEGTRYRAFPNVRLNDLFKITSSENRGAIYARLRDKHVDFLLVELPDYRPVLAIELDGASHDTEKQQYRDAVKDVAFKSGGLLLLRLDARQAHTSSSIREVLTAHLKLTPVRIK